MKLAKIDINMWPGGAVGWSAWLGLSSQLARKRNVGALPWSTRDLVVISPRIAELNEATDGRHKHTPERVVRNDPVADLLHNTIDTHTLASRDNVFCMLPAIIAR